MPKNTRTAEWESRLVRAVKESCRMMEPIRRRRRMLISEYAAGQFDEKVASYYKLPMAKGKRPYNMLHQGVSMTVPYLTGSDPVAHFVPKRVGMQPAAFLMGEALMHLNRQQRFLRKIRRCVMDAMFGAGVMYTHIDLSGREPDEDVKFDMAEVFSQSVSLDDYLLDASCRHRDERRFEGHINRGDKDALLESEFFSKEFIDAMPNHQERYQDNETAYKDMLPNEVDGEETTTLARVGYYTQLYLPREKVIVYLPGSREEDFHEGMPIEVQDYYGPDDGSYTVLGFDWVPDNPLPIAPVGLWLDLHLAVNLMAGKIVTNSKAMKNLILFPEDMKDDAERIRTMPDDGVGTVQDPTKVGTFQVGGVSMDSINAFNLFQRSLNEIQGGENVQRAKTATQAQIVASGGQIRMGDLQGLVEQWVRDTCEVRAWHIWPGNNPDVEMPLHKMVNDVMVFLPFNADMVDGDWLDLHFDIEVGSMLRKDERQEVVDKMDHGQLILQAMEMEMMSEGRFNAEEFVRITGRNVWRPGELERVFQSQDTMLNQMLGMQPVGMQAKVSRLGTIANYPNRPGRPGAKNRLQTGSSSRDYDTGAQAVARTESSNTTY